MKVRELSLISLIILISIGSSNGQKKQIITSAKELETVEKNKKAFRMLGITDNDLIRVGTGDGVSEPPPLTAGDEYIDEALPEEKTEDWLNADEMYRRGLGFIERGRPQGEEARQAAFKLFDRAAHMGHADAQKIMAFAHLLGDNARWSLDESRRLFTSLSKSGSADALLGLGFMHAVGLGVPKSSQARALVYYTFAAQAGSPLAQMAMGYRYYAGVGVPASCEEALGYYSKVAELVANQVRFSTSLSIQRIRLTDEMEPTGQTQTSSPMDSNLLDYYKFLADKGDVSAQLGLGQLFLTGGRGIEQNFDEANRYLTTAAEAGNAAAYAYLGKMYLDGTPATPQDNVTAFHFFLKSADKSNQIGQAGLGIMYLQGRGVKQDYNKALKLFTFAAEQGWVDGQLYLGVMHLQGLGVPTRDAKQAVKFFQLASQNGHVLGYYNLAHMHANGIGVIRSCTTAVEFYKNVAERGRWTERLMEAYAAYKANRPNEAAMKYLFMAELGYEQAQTNFAFILDRDEARSIFPEIRQEVLSRALHQWKRAASQEYAVARVKLGDYYYYGYGTDPDYTEAAHHYKIAADLHISQAMFNLGYMHEKGEGLTQDLYLAKRYYDSAMEHSPDALVPCALALMKLGVLFAFMKMSETKIGEALIGFHNWDLVIMLAALGGTVYLLYILVNRNQPQPADDHEHQE